MEQTQTQSWIRRDSPLLTNSPPPKPWMKSGLYCPRVIFANGKYRMWFMATPVRPTLLQVQVGYAESEDGISWDLHPDTVLSGESIPWGKDIQTPWVMFDEGEELYKMWFVSTTSFEYREDGVTFSDLKQDLGYATSPNGINWEVRPEPLVEACRAPCVIKEEGRYRMWMNARPTVDDTYDTVYASIYEYHSSNGINWTRQDDPAVRATGRTKTAVYPYVKRIRGTYYMWHIGHMLDKQLGRIEPDGPGGGGDYEIFCDISVDGSCWQINHEVPAFASAGDIDRFDWRWVSTPCVIEKGEVFRLYYAAANDPRINHNLFEGSNDGKGMHIGLAEMLKDSLQD